MTRSVARGATLASFVALPFAAVCGGEGTGGGSRGDDGSGHDTPRTHRIQIQEMGFQPPRLAVAPGDTVIWLNRDIVPHTVTAADGSWGSGELKQGERWTRVVHGGGAIDYFCAYHSTMEGRLENDGRPARKGGDR